MQATSPVSYLTPPPEIPTTLHAIEPPSFGVQDASNQTDAPEDTEEQKQEPFVKQEQNPSPCQVASSPNGTNLTAANFEIVAPPTERICNVVRITTTTTTMNPTACGIVAKVDKAENTIINMADCAKFSAKDNRNIVGSIERDARIDEETRKDEKIPPTCSRNNRIGARIIEITEENCDSFHENLEFFARRKDLSADEHRDSYSKDDNNVAQESATQEKIEIGSKTINTAENIIEGHRPVCSKTEPSIFSQAKPSVADSTESSKVNCESCDKNRNASANNEARPQITVKCFDMPNIDDDQEVQQVVVKQEADDSCYEVCYESQCEPTSTSERSRPSSEKLSPEVTKRHSAEKSHYSGIENVVEKLKKNAAALQEASLPVSRKVEESAEESSMEKIKSRRQFETIPKKLHFLRSCQNSMENNVDTEVSSSQIAMTEHHAQDQSGPFSPRVEDTDEDRHSLTSSKCDTSGECLLGDNNNDSKSNNNNIKPEYKKVLTKNERNLSCDVTAYVKPKTALRWRSEVEPSIKVHNAARKCDSVEDTSPEVKPATQRQKLTIDVSGLELLSNSIEQLEQRVGQPEHPQVDADIEKSPMMSRQGENNNNVGSRLGLLCALAEQIMKVDDKAPRKTNLENSEEISHAGRLLLDLGRGGYPEKDENKRKHVESQDLYSKRLKFDDCEGPTDRNVSRNYHEEDTKDRSLKDTERHQEESLLKLKGNTKYHIDFSEEETEKAISLEKRSFDEDVRTCCSNKCAVKSTKEVDVSSDGTPDNDGKENNLSDSENEVFVEAKIPSGQTTSYEAENKKRKTSIEERDGHDYKNARTKSEAKKFLAKKGNRDNEDDWPNMNATELDMRVRMADIQRQYREKQKELSKLTPKKDDKKNVRPRKKSHSSVR